MQQFIYNYGSSRWEHVTGDQNDQMRHAILSTGMRRHWRLEHQASWFVPRLN
jgi:hypothetical protein